MSGAIVWARCSLASRAVVTVVAVALSGGSIADTFVGAFHVVVGRVVDRSAGTILHVREKLLSSVRVNLGSNKNTTGRDRVIVVQITLRCIDVSVVEWAGSLRTVGGLPVSVTGAHIEYTACSVTGACVWALGGG
jgi:hypothetical protein